MTDSVRTSDTWFDWLDAIPDAALVVSSTGRIVRANLHAARMFGYSTLTGREVEELIPPDARERHRAEVKGFSVQRRHTMAAGRDVYGVRGDGTTIELEIAIKQQEGAYSSHTVAVVRDVTARRVAERHAQANVAKLEAMKQLGRVGSFSFYVERDLREFSPELLEMLRRERAPGSSEEFFADVHPEDRAELRVALARTISTHEPYSLLCRLRRYGDDSWRWVKSRVSARLDEQRGLVVHGLVTDVTAEHDAIVREELEQARLHQILETSPDMFMVTDLAGRIEYASRTFSGAKGDALVGRSLFENILVSEIPTVRNALEEAHRTGATVRVDSSARDLSGAERALRSRIRLLDETHLLLVISDVTERKRAEQQVQELRAAMEHAVEGVAKVDRNGTVVSANLTFARLSGASDTSAVVGRSWSDVFAAHARPQAESGAEIARTQGRAEIELEGGRVESRFGMRSATLVRSQDAAGVDTGFYCFIQDTTERRRVREQLVLSDRMVSLGMLAAGVAHEINNPLASIVANLEMLHEDLREEGQFHESLIDAREAAERVRQIVADLQIFSRRSSDSLGPVAIEPVVDSALRMVRNELRHRASLIRRMEVTLPVLANEARLGQVVLNLVINALHALPSSGFDRNRVEVTTRPGPSGTVLLEVSDNGSGISPEAREHLFTPFFTTKPAGIGTGLGLSICDRIVSGFGGRIEVESEVGMGTTFRVVLPTAATVAETPRRSSLPRQPLRHQRPRALVIDDDPLAGRAAERALTGVCEVSLATDVVQAMNEISTWGVYDVILCDLMMPRLSGPELYERVCEIAPQLASRFAFVTGGPFDQDVRGFVERQSHRTLTKPYSVEALRELVLRVAGEAR